MIRTVIIAAVLLVVAAIVIGAYCALVEVSRKAEEMERREDD